MKARDILVPCALSFLLAGTVLAQGSTEAKVETKEKSKAVPKAAASRAVIIPATDLKWVDLDPVGAPGVKAADVWGDHTKGAFGGFTKFPAGFATPLHTHTHDFKIVVISGTFIHTPEGKAEIRLGPGSYFLQPGGNYKHATACDKASECLFFIQSGGKFDLKPVKTAAAASEEPEKK
jgi:quercetin dioxygenase-like cupin family protein